MGELYRRWRARGYLSVRALQLLAPASTLPVVMAGLDPATQQGVPPARSLVRLRCSLGGRVKPGHDGGWGGDRLEAPREGARMADEGAVRWRRPHGELVEPRGRAHRRSGLGCHALVVRQTHHEGCCWSGREGLLAIHSNWSAGAAPWIPARRCAAAGMTAVGVDDCGEWASNQDGRAPFTVHSSPSASRIACSTGE